MDDVRWLDEREARMWRGWLAMRRDLDTVVERKLAEAGLSSADYELLVPLSESPGEVLRARDLAAAVGWDRSRLSHQLRRMEQRGLLERFVCETDLRGTMIRLTDAGRAAVGSAAPGHVETVRRYFIDVLDPPDVEVLTRIAERVRRAVRDEVAGSA